jgi:hypothetical protein
VFVQQEPLVFFPAAMLVVLVFGFDFLFGEKKNRTQ